MVIAERVYRFESCPDYKKTLMLWLGIEEYTSHSKQVKRALQLPHRYLLTEPHSDTVAMERPPALR